MVILWQLRSPLWPILLWIKMRRLFWAEMPGRTQRDQSMQTWRTDKPINAESIFIGLSAYRLIGAGRFELAMPVCWLFSWYFHFYFEMDKSKQMHRNQTKIWPGQKLVTNEYPGMSIYVCKWVCKFLCVVGMSWCLSVWWICERMSWCVCRWVRAALSMYVCVCARVSMWWVYVRNCMMSMSMRVGGAMARHTTQIMKMTSLEITSSRESRFHFVLLVTGR